MEVLASAPQPSDRRLGAPCGSADQDEDGGPEQIRSGKASAAAEPDESAPKRTYEMSPGEELPRAPQGGTHLLRDLAEKVTERRHDATKFL